MNQPLKALISAWAKKFIASHLLQTFTSKEHNNSQGVFPTMIGFVTLASHFFIPQVFLFSIHFIHMHIYGIFTDNLSIRIESKNLVIGKGNTAYFNATANGISTDISNFMYQWRKRGSNSFPDKVSGINGPLLTIPSIAESDEGQYYCTVTNEWSRSVESDDATLTVYGMHFMINMYAKQLLSLYIRVIHVLIISGIYLCR